MRGLIGVDQEALLRVAVAQLLFGAGFGHLLVDLAARVGVLQDVFGHGYCAASTSLRARGQLELEQLGVERRVHLLLVEVEFQDGVVVAGHLARAWIWLVRA